MVHFYEQQNYLPLHPTSKLACVPAHALTAHPALENWSMQNSSGAGMGIGKLGANEVKRASDSPLHLQQSSSVLNPLFTLSLLVRLSLTKRFGRRRIWEEEKKEEGGRRKEGRKRGSRRSSKSLL